MGVGRGGWAWALLAGVALSAGLAVDGRISRAPPARTAPPLGAAAAADVAACPAWTIVAGQGEVTATSVALFTDGVAQLRPCAGASVEVRLSGTRVGGVGPWAVLETAAGVVYAGHVGSDGVAVRVDAAAWLAFTNDRVAGGEDRNLRATLR